MGIYSIGSKLMVRIMDNQMEQEMEHEMDTGV